MTTDNKNHGVAGNTGWPGGWYVYENGKVEGPYSAGEAFRMEAETSDGKPRLVSRKGFSQWYSLKDLSEIFQLTEQLGTKVGEHGRMTEAQLAALRSSVSPTPPPPAPMKVQGKRVEVGGIQAPAAAQAKAQAKMMAPTPGRPAKSKPPVTMADLGFEPDREKTAGSATTMAARQAKASGPFTEARPAVAPAAKKGTAKTALMQEYFLARGRLRLGKLRNPWMTGMVGLPLSLGVYWILWMGDLAREASLHARNQERGTMPPIGLALIPFVHMYMAYRLAKLVNEMETQNRYATVKPGLAAALALVPPAAVVYLQAAANRHWLLHAKHAVMKRQSEVA